MWELLCPCRACCRCSPLKISPESACATCWSPTSISITQAGPVACCRSCRRPRWSYLRAARRAARRHDLIDEYVALARAVAGAGAARHRSLTEGLSQLLWRAVQAHGCTMSHERAEELLAIDIA